VAGKGSLWPLRAAALATNPLHLLPSLLPLQHDDGVDKEARKAMLSVTEGRVTASGCPVRGSQGG
jgi:hypothetical protein